MSPAHASDEILETHDVGDEDGHTTFVIEMKKKRPLQNKHLWAETICYQISFEHRLKDSFCKIFDTVHVALMKWERWKTEEDPSRRSRRSVSSLGENGKNLLEGNKTNLEILKEIKEKNGSYYY